MDDAHNDGCVLTSIVVHEGSYVLTHALPLYSSLVGFAASATVVSMMTTD